MPKGIYALLIGATALLTITLGIVIAMATGFITPPGLKQPEQATANTEVDYSKAKYIKLGESLTVNFSDGEQMRYLEADIQAQTRQEKVAKALETHQAAIRDELIMLFSEQTPEDLNNTQGREALRKEAKQIINDILEKHGLEGRVDAVYFTNFVVQ